MATGGVALAALVPHPPVAVPEVGGADWNRVRETAAAMERLAEVVAQERVDSMLLVTPHGPARRGTVFLWGRDPVAGDLAAFGAPETRISFPLDAELERALVAAAGDAGVFVARRSSWYGYGGREGLDHGAAVPLYFFSRAGLALPLVVAAIAPDPVPALYAFGLSVRRAAAKAGRRLAVIASGDLSHRLRPGAPAGFHPAGAVFDRSLVRLIGAGERGDVLAMPEELAEDAGQDVLPSLAVAFGALHGLEAPVELLSYQAPFGVGYAVACWRVAGPHEESYPVRLARRALEEGLRGRPLPAGEDAPPEFRRPAAAFVSLKRFGELRGCVGTIAPTRPTLAEEIAANALAAARDPRCPPVTAGELPEMEISVDVLGPMEPVRSAEDLDPARYGILVAKGARRGILLPALPGVETPEQQLAISCRKAGLRPDEGGLAIYRFTTTRYR